MNNQTTIMNFTHAYEQESVLCNNNFRWVDCTQILGTYGYCDKLAERQIKNLIKTISPYGIHFFDSGNYHYVSLFWINKIKKPFSLIVFDHHCDIQAPLWDNYLSCGSWLREILEKNEYIQAVLICGVSSQNIDKCNISDSRIEILTENFTEHELSQKLNSLNDFPVYISIDKDILSPRFARTDWDQGTFSLNKLLKTIQSIKDKKEIMGIDVCGDESFSMSKRNFITDNRINSLTNTKLLDFFHQIFQQE